MTHIEHILRNLANDDTIEKDYLVVGWRDMLLGLAKEINEKEKRRVKLLKKINIFTRLKHITIRSNWYTITER